MRGRDTKCAAVKCATWGVLLVVVAAGCASTTAPSKWLPGPTDVGQFPRGAWVTVERKQNGKTEEVHGELIAVSDSTITVFADAKWPRETNRSGDDVWIELLRPNVKKVKATFFASNHGPMALWTLVGTLSTPSHGFGLIGSLPLWIIFGSSFTAHASKEPEIVFPKSDWSELRPYARFPQGRPEGFAETREEES